MLCPYTKLSVGFRELLHRARMYLWAICYVSKMIYKLSWPLLWVGRKTIWKSAFVTHVMMRVSSPGSPRTPSTNRGLLVKLYLFQKCPSSKLNLGRKKKKKRYAGQLCNYCPYFLICLSNIYYVKKVCHEQPNLLRIQFNQAHKIFEGIWLYKQLLKEEKG